MDIEQLKQMVDLFMSKGFTYGDMNRSFKDTYVYVTWKKHEADTGGAGSTKGVFYDSIQ